MTKEEPKIFYFDLHLMVSSALISVTGKGRLNEIFIMCICLLLRQSSIACHLLKCKSQIKVLN